jgi:hypothetical protein
LNWHLIDYQKVYHEWSSREIYFPRIAGNKFLDYSIRWVEKVLAENDFLFSAKKGIFAVVLAENDFLFSAKTIAKYNLG